ncbi:MAG: DUF4330 family protein [Oscillospiraceae bacterium]|nr:DUF4330 family protein [Oscillospiraceae bacterium]
MKEASKKRGLNPIDVLVIIVVIAAVAFGAYKLVNRSRQGSVAGTPITFTVLCSGVEPDVYESLKDLLPSQLMASGEMVSGKVTAVTASPHTPGVLSSGTGLPITVEKEGLLDLTFTIEGEVRNLITNELGKQEIRIGKTYTVKTVDVELERGVILDFQRGEAGE